MTNLAGFGKPRRPRRGRRRGAAPGILMRWAVLLAAAAPGTAPAAEAPPAETAARTEEDQARRARIDDMYRDYRRAFPEVPEVTAAELLALPDTVPVILVDVRSEAERDVSVIPGAITPEELRATGDRYRGHRVVCYCTIGYRSGVAARRLREEGWAAENLAGSLLAWVDEGGRLVDADGPTRRVHVYGRRWNLLPPGYEPVW